MRPCLAVPMATTLTLIPVGATTYSTPLDLSSSTNNVNRESRFRQSCQGKVSQRVPRLTGRSSTQLPEDSRVASGKERTTTDDPGGDRKWEGKWAESPPMREVDRREESTGSLANGTSPNSTYTHTSTYIR